MATDVKSGGDSSVTSLVSGVINDAQELMRQQLALLKAEVREDLRKTREAAVLMATGLGIALLGVLLLAFTLVYAVNELLHVPLWASFAICTLVLLAGGGALCFVAKKQFDSFNPLPDQTAKALEENVQWITKPK
jgi:hypothetical protein